jgi:hypothetical protein
MVGHTELTGALNGTQPTASKASQERCFAGIKKPR